MLSEVIAFYITYVLLVYVFVMDVKSWKRQYFVGNV